MSLKVRQSRTATGATIYWPDAAPCGGVVCLHGSEGGSSGWNHVNCALLAANGFAAMAHSYAENGPFLTHPDIDNVPLEGAEAALFCLREEMAAYGCGVGLFGASRGAELALLLADILAEEDSPAVPDAIAVHSPPDQAWPAYIVADFQTGQEWAGDRERPAWSWRGEHGRTRPGVLLGSGRFAGPVFVTQGTADRVWGDAMARHLVAQMTAKGTAPEAHFFDGEDHVFQADVCNREWELLTEFFRRTLSFGGR